MSKAKVHLTKPLLIMLYGVPGAGKSYFSRNLATDIELAHLNSDKIRGELFESPQFDKQENDILSHIMDYMTSEFLQAGTSVIYDTNTIRLKQRHEIREMARRKDVKTLLIWFQIDSTSGYERIKKRDRRTADDRYSVNYTEESIRNYMAHMQHPEPTENYVVISGKHTYGSQKNSVFKKLMEMGYIGQQQAQQKVAKPGLVNLVPSNMVGRVDLSRRNINIR